MKENEQFVEAYIENGELGALLSLFNLVIGSFKSIGSWEQGCHKYSCGMVTLIFVENVDEKYLGVEVRGAGNWDTHAQFARFLSNRLCLAVRCDPGFDYQNIVPYSDIFLEISHGVETLANWR
jgi:hypothetical protein